MVKKSEKLSQAVLILIYVAACIGLGVYCGYSIDAYFAGHFVLAYAVILLCVAGAFLLHVVFHELGHLVFGRLTGYGFQSFRLGSLMWQRNSDGKIRFYRYRLAGTGGQCLMSPPPLRDGDMPYVLYNLGGVIFNLLLSAAGGVLSALVPSGTVAAIFGLMLCVIGVTMALTNGLPLPGVSNDGSNCLSLSKSKEARQSFRMQMSGVVLLSQGKRIKGFPAAWFVKPDEAQMQNVITATMAVYVCDKYMEEHDFAAAQAYIDELLGRKTAMTAMHLNLLRVNALYCELVGGQSAEKIEAYTNDEYKAFVKTMPTNPGVLRTRYAYEKLYQKDGAQAAKCLAQFEKAAKTYPYPCEIEAERELIAIADERAAAVSDAP